MCCCDFEAFTVKVKCIFCFMLIVRLVIFRLFYYVIVASRFCFLLLTVPTSNLYVQLNSLQLFVDPASVLWISLFSRGLLHTLDQVKAFYHLQDSSKAEEHVDIRMDASHLKVNTLLY